MSIYPTLHPPSSLPPCHSCLPPPSPLSLLLIPPLSPSLPSYYLPSSPFTLLLLFSLFISPFFLFSPLSFSSHLLSLHSPSSFLSLPSPSFPSPPSPSAEGMPDFFDGDDAHDRYVEVKHVLSPPLLDDAKVRSPCTVRTVTIVTSEIQRSYLWIWFNSMSMCGLYMAYSSAKFDKIASILSCTPYHTSSHLVTSSPT